MKTKKLKLDKVTVETFETGGGEAPPRGTVGGYETVDVRTCWGQTGACTACPPIQCY
ncbi:MAG TPA: hypothetical protein VGX50_02635 [Longimicrobium sp.]|nr:hypothetical protein [Longimicrobium sp.]